MFDIVQKALFTGLGLASMTREKLEALGKELSTHAKLSEEQTAQFQAELKSRAQQAKTEFDEEVDRRLESLIKSVGLVRKEELATLQERIERLEQKAAGGPA
jgi:polyhydroxyalkanoate synthesis regulator phasin